MNRTLSALLAAGGVTIMILMLPLAMAAATAPAEEAVVPLKTALARAADDAEAQGDTALAAKVELLAKRADVLERRVDEIEHGKAERRPLAYR